MSTAKVRKLKRELAYTATWLADVLTITTATHYMKTGDIISLSFNDSNQEWNNVAITYVDATSFTIPLVAADRSKVQLAGRVVIPFFSTGQTGDSAVFSVSKTMDVPSILQLTAKGTGGATLVLWLSNDGEGWINAATVTLSTVNLNSEFVQIAPNWTKAKLNVTVIGAATSVVATITS